MYIKDIEHREELTLVSDSQDCERIKEDCPEAAEYDSFFVNVEGGEYSEIYGFFGIVPVLTKPLYRVR